MSQHIMSDAIRLRFGVVRGVLKTPPSETMTQGVSVRATQSPKKLYRFSEGRRLRTAERRLLGSWIQEPPRNTRRLQSPLRRAPPG